MKTSCKKLGVVASMLAALVLVLLLTPGEAQARRRYYGSSMGEPGLSTLGIGLILGTPTGLSLELRLSPSSAFDFAIGFGSFDDDDYDDHDDGYLHFDYLAYLTDLAGGGSVAVPFYLGVGAAIWDDDRYNDYDDDINLAVRVPFGLAIALRQAPVQFFFELALRVLVIDDDDGRNDDDVDLTGGLGFRVYF